MHSLSHLAGGVSLSLGFSYDTLEPYFIVGALIGAKAPDLLEFPRTLFNSKRVGIVPHRTITHWGLLWVLCFVWSLGYAEKTSLSMFLLGLSAGGIIHLIQDACTPMGVPILLPFEKRFTFNLVHGWLSELYVNLGLLPVFFTTGYMLVTLI